MRSAAAIIVTITLMSGCATGYGALAGAGALASVAAIGAAASGQMHPAVAAGEGLVLGALAGAIGGAVASAVVRGRERRANEDLRMQLHLQRQRDEQAFEERLQRLEAARFSSATAEPIDPRRSAVRRSDDTPAQSNSLELSPHVREFSAE